MPDKERLRDVPDTIHNLLEVIGNGIWSSTQVSQRGKTNVEAIPTGMEIILPLLTPIGASASNNSFGDHIP